MQLGVDPHLVAQFVRQISTLIAKAAEILVTEMFVMLDEHRVRILGAENQRTLRFAMRVEQRDRVVDHGDAILQRHDAIHQTDAVRALRVKKDMRRLLDACRRRRAETHTVLGHRFIHLLAVPAFGNFGGLCLSRRGAQRQCGCSQAESAATSEFGHG